MMKQPLKLVLSIGVCLMAGVVGSVFNIAAIPTWYTTINKPFFNPPNWVFGPVWTTLFILMGISLYLVWREGSKKKEVRKGLGLFRFQLLLNVLWSGLFFGLRSPALGFIGIVALWVMIFLTIKQFNKVSKEAAWLLIPYIAWVSFASILNLSIWALNA